VVQARRPGLKLEYRRGYYAPADFQHSNRADRGLQLDEELASELPTTDLPVYLATAIAIATAATRWIDTPAIRLYGSLGFTHQGTDVMFRYPPAG